MAINLTRHKMISFCASSFFAGWAARCWPCTRTPCSQELHRGHDLRDLLVVDIGGIGSVTGSCLSEFLFVACSEWWLRFLDQELIIGGWQVPLLRNGFRLVVFLHPSS